MNFGVLLMTFGLVIPAELPDKTFISCVVMASRHRPLAVWLGGACALILQAAVAVVAGRLMELLPHTAVESVIAALFVAGAAYLIIVPESHEGPVGDDGDEPVHDVGRAEFWRPMLATFGLVALAEFGDVTQILIANLTARYRATVSVFIGAAAAFMVVSGFAVVAGRNIVRVVPLSVVRRISGLALLALGIYTIAELV